jgi:3-phenylpropionate/cinnamic acid dioxygenase small subunit
MGETNGRRNVTEDSENDRRQLPRGYAMSAALTERRSLAEIVGPADIALWFEIQQFLFHEARLIDDRKFTEWAELFTEDVRYWMPIVSNRIGRDVGREQTTRDELSHFEEDKTSLVNRVRRLSTGMAWAETPPSRTRHVVGNVEVQRTANADEVAVRSSFIVYRSHLEYDSEFFVGRRDDYLCREGVTWRIADRVLHLDQNVVTQKSLSIFL